MSQERWLSWALLAFSLFCIIPLYISVSNSNWPAVTITFIVIVISAGSSGFFQEIADRREK